jgi:NADPH:quinone reductase-like Zn-dependent oxidoreductase
MKAIFLTKNGNANEAFEIREVSLDALQRGEVKIKVSASGLNFADVLGRKGLYPELPALPVIMGYDVVGEVIECGEGVDPAWKGKRVAALTRFGGYAEEVNTLADGIAEVPEQMQDFEACALGTQYVTAYYMASIVQESRRGDAVLVHAASGGVGTALVQLLLNKGCEVFATVGSDEKVNELMRLGVKAVNYRANDYAAFVKSHLGNAYLQASYNSIGGKTFKKDMNLIGAGGKLMLYGFAERSGKWGGKLATLKLIWDMGRLIPLLLLAKSKGVIGINMLKVAQANPQLIGQCMNELVQLYIENKIKPINGGEYSYSEVALAHHLLESRKTKGKLIVKWQ